MKTYLLSLHDDHERRAHLASQFGVRFRSFELVTAIDGRSGTPMHPFQIAPHNKHKPLSGPEVACALSHIKIYNTILSRPEPEGRFNLILEDDVIGRSSDLDRIEAILKQLPENCVIILGGQEGMPRARHLYGRPTRIANVYEISRMHLRNLARTCCYAIDQTAASSLLSAQQAGLKRADDWQHLIHSRTKMYYCPIISHPNQIFESSHIESSRQHLVAKSMLVRWRRDGLRESLTRPLIRLLTPLLAPWLKLRRIH